MDKNKVLYIYRIWLLLAVFAFAACSDDSLVGDDARQFTALTIDATPSATRTSLDEDGTTVLWQSDDHIAVYDYKSSKRDFAAQVGSDGHTKFTGQVTAKSQYFAAIYPYALAGESASANSALAATLPATQYAVASGFPTDGETCVNLSVAKGERNLDGSPAVVTFHNVCQLLRFTVPAYAAGKISSIQFTASTAVAGKLNIDYSGNAPTTTIGSSESKVITVLPPRRTSTFDAGTYYIVTAPVRLAGFSMKSAAGSKTYSLSSTTTFGGQAGRVYNLGSIDLVNIPTASASHVYSSNVLQGTRLTLTGAPITGQPWTATVKNGSGKTVRTLSGTGDLASDETDASWPYLPAGSYTVQYTYTTSNARQVSGSINLTVPAPTLKLTVDAYTAHSLYEAGNVTGANECDRLTVYSPKATLSVASALMSNTNYTRTFARTINGQTTTTTESTNTPSWANFTNIPVSGSLHTLSVTANFGGTTVTATKQVRITGLPANFTPPTEGTGWSKDEGTVNFNSDHVRLGNYSTSQPHRIKNASWFNIPSGTRIALDYDIVLHRAAVNTTANVKMGDQQIVECTNSKYNSDVHNTGVTQATLSANVTSVTCEGSYGSGATCTKVYKLYFKYGSN